MEQGLSKIQALFPQGLDPDFISVIDFNPDINWLTTDTAIISILLLIYCAINLMLYHFPTMRALDEYGFDGVH